jgi:hypothetical protein
MAIFNSKLLVYQAGHIISNAMSAMPKSQLDTRAIPTGKFGKCVLRLDTKEQRVGEIPNDEAD